MELPLAVLAYLSRCARRVAISNRRLIAADAEAATFRSRTTRGPGRYKTMMLDAHEFIRRFLIHVLPRRFHRIRHPGTRHAEGRWIFVQAVRKVRI
jgi:hypothetical protein